MRFSDFFFISFLMFFVKYYSVSAYLVMQSNTRPYVCLSRADIVSKRVCMYYSKKAMLSQGNRAMSQLFVSV